MHNVISSNTGHKAIASDDAYQGATKLQESGCRISKKLHSIHHRIRSAFRGTRPIILALLFLLAIPNALAALELNLLAPIEADIGGSIIIIAHANNSGSNANKISMNITMPEGFFYNQGSARITTPAGTSQQEPIVRGRYLNWSNSAWSLASGQSIRIRLNLTAGCNAPSGRRIAFDARSNSGTASTVSLSILVNSGLLKITKEPNVIEASRGDQVNWTVKIENQGTGAAYNVLISDTPSAGLQLLDIDSPGGLLNWSYARIDPGTTRMVNTSFRVTGCNDLVNLVAASWSSGNGVCQETYAKGSIKYVPRDPDIDYTITPSPIVLPYCGSVRVNVTLTNSGPGNASKLRMYLLNFSSPCRISDVIGAVYSESNTTFSLGDIPGGDVLNRGEVKTFSFNFSMPLQGCSAKGSGDILDFRVNYLDDCGNEWYPPASLVVSSMDPESIPSISASKAGTESLYIGETGKYTLSVSYTKGNCRQDSLPNSIITDRYPENFEVIDAAGGKVDIESHSITWINEPLNNTVPWSKTIYLKASESDNCSCGAVFVNDFSVNASEDCCGCPLYASTSFPIIVECFNNTVLSGSEKIATPGRQENCREVVYTNTYTFNKTSNLSWKEISFYEAAANGQTFPDGNLLGNATFSIGNLCSVQSPIILGQNNSLSFLDDACGPLKDKDQLRISYNLSQPRSGSFVDWSGLCVEGYNSKCKRVPCFQEGAAVSVSQADWSIAIRSVPEIMSPCQLFNLTIDLVKNSPNDDSRWIADDLNITFSDALYCYIGPCRINGIVNQSGAVQSFEPRRRGSNLVWELGDVVIRGGSITFQVQKTCPERGSASAWLNYIDHCAAAVARSAESSPLSLTRGDLIIMKTPETVYTLDRTAAWKIYVTNRGSGTARNVTVVDRLDSDLSYNGSAIKRCSSCPFIPEPANTTVINRNPCGPDTAIWRIGDLTPKQQVTIKLNSTICGCQNRDNRVYATIGCRGEICQNISAFSHVELVDPRLLVARHDAGKVNDCGSPDPFVIEVRSAGAYVYNLTISEELPEGLKLNGTPVVSGALLTSRDYNTTGLLVWRFFSPEGIKPGARISIRFNASVSSPCAFKGGTSRVSCSYIEPCGQPGPLLTSEIPVQKYQPSLTISKNPSTIYASSGSIVRWTITLSSTGDLPAQNVTLRDVLPANTVPHSAYPQMDKGTGSSQDPLVWRLPDIAPGKTVTVRLNATVTSCMAQTKDTANVSWGCCPPPAAVTTANLVTRPAASATPSVGQLANLNVCGGDLTLTVRNTGAAALVANLTDILPVGFIYQKNSALITSNNATHKASFTQHEPLDFSSQNRTLIWDSANIDRIYYGETITIRFKVINCPGCCQAAKNSKNTLQFYYKDTCGNLIPPVSNVQNVAPKIASLSVRKEPAVQFQGNVSWTVYIDNSGTVTAENVSVLDVLGDGFYGVVSANGTLAKNQPLPNQTSIIWTGQRIPVGSGRWSTTVSARSDETCGLAHTNNVTVRGHCSSGCIYSNDSATARALSPAAFELSSLESLLRSQAQLIAGFESLLESTNLDHNASIQFLDSYEDLSKRQQTGLEGFEDLVRCNWRDLSETERINLTISFSDLLTRQGETISGNGLLLERSYCQLDSSEKVALLSDLEDRLHKEQDLLNSFRSWVQSQKSLENREKGTWYRFLASYEDLIRCQARLIAAFEQIMYSRCDGTYFSVGESSNLTHADAGKPVNYTILVNNSGPATIRNITVNSYLYGEVQGLPGIDLAPGDKRSFSRSARLNCSYCDGCACKVCDFALACGDVQKDATNKTHVCITGNEVCINVSETGLGAAYPG